MGAYSQSFEGIKLITLILFEILGGLKTKKPLDNQEVTGCGGRI